MEGAAAAPSNSQPQKKQRLFRFIAHYVAVGLLFSSFIGLVVHALFTRVPGPARLSDHFPGVWMCALLVFFAAEVLSELHKQRSAHRIANIVFWSACALLALLVWMGYLMQGSDNTIGIAWSTLLLAVICCGLTCVTWARVPLRWRVGDAAEASEAVETTVAENDILHPLEQLASRNDHCRRACAFTSVTNGVFRVLVVLVLVLLVSGAMQSGAGYARFPPRGGFVTIYTADGRPTRINVLCEGDGTAGKPVLWLVAGGGHWMGDLLGLSSYLQAAGRRVCIADRPGGGRSGWPTAANNYPDWLHSTIVASGEPRPSIVVGMAEAWSEAYKYGVRNPADTKAVVMLGPQPRGLRYFLLNGTADPAPGPLPSGMPTEAETRARFKLAQLIRGLAVPWGLMGIFVPWNPTNFTPADAYAEFHWFATTAKFWTMQNFELLALYNDTSLDVLRMSDSVVLANIVNRNSTDTALHPFPDPLPSARNSTVAVCEGCDLLFAVKKPQWTAERIIELVGHLLR